MPKDKNRLYRRLFLRSLVGIVVVLPVSLLYDSALTDLTARQAEIQNRGILLTLPGAMIGFLLVVRFWLAPLTRTFQVLEAGEKLAPTDSVAAERRALVMPYMIGAYLGAAFFLISLIVNFAMYLKAGLGLDSLIYLVASSITTALMYGLGSSLLLKPVFRDALLIIITNSSEHPDTPPFFLPIAVKLTGSFMIVVALLLIFSGLLASVIAQRLIARERESAQRTELANLIGIFGRADFTPDRLEATLRDLSGPDRVFRYEETKPDHALPGEAWKDPDRGWTWIFVPLPDGRGALVSGTAPLVSRDVVAELFKYYGGAALVALLVAATVGVFLSRDVSVTLKELSHSARLIAQGADDAPVVAGGDDETGTLARAFNHMNRVLLSQLRHELLERRSMIETIGLTLETLGPMARELASFTNQQASSSLEQSAAAQQSAATCTEVAAISNRISETSGQVVAAAEGTLAAARRGQERIKVTRAGFEDVKSKVDDLHATVRELAEHSKAIGGIIDLIEEIGDQINLLALNASLEAAGAGEFGRRFEVVASEVLRLAARANSSTRHVMGIVESMKAMIEQSRVRAEEGAQAVGVGMESVQDISRLFDEVHLASLQTADMVREIDTITHQQASASDQMSNAMAGVEDTAKQSSASAQQLQASVRSIMEIIGRLRQHSGEPDQTD